MKSIKYVLPIFFTITFCLGCKKKKEAISITPKAELVKMDYAKGFYITKEASGLTLIHISSPWPDAKTAFTYALVPKEKKEHINLNKHEYDAIIPVPVEKIIVTSTTHIPALESLGVLNKLVGFPHTNLISSKPARERIDQGLIQDLGNHKSINTERVLSLNPDVIIGFSIDHKSKAYNTLRNSGIPVAYNGDWAEENPLGKAEWIKFFAPFFNKEKEAEQLFKKIETSYHTAKTLALKATSKPTVLTGALHKDIWHVAGGKSWMAQFLKDAQTNYLWKKNIKTGGIAVSFETVLHTAQKADFWLNPSMLASYKDMKLANRHYQKFEAFNTKKIYTNTNTKGATGGLLYYEIAPQRPDLVLKDLIHIFHPELLPNHSLQFFKPLH